MHTVCLSDCKPVCLFAFTSAALLPFKLVSISCLCWRDVCLKLRGFYLNAVFTFVYSTSIVFVCLRPQQRLLLSIPFFIYCFRLFQSLSFSIYAFRARCIPCACERAAQWCWSKNEHYMANKVFEEFPFIISMCTDFPWVKYAFYSSFASWTIPA